MIISLADKGTSDNSPFSIDAISGELRVSDNLDRDKATGGVEYYNVTVQAKDGGDTAQSVERTVTILLLNVNDNPPTLDTPTSLVTVPENKAVGDVIFNFTSGTDIDGDDVTFSVVGGDFAFFEAANGSLRVLQGFNYEEKTMYNVILRYVELKSVKYFESQFLKHFYKYLFQETQPFII